MSTAAIVAICCLMSRLEVLHTCTVSIFSPGQEAGIPGLADARVGWTHRVRTDQTRSYQFMALDSSCKQM